MKRTRRTLILVAIAGGALVITIGLANVIAFYSQIALISPALAKLLVGVIGAIAALLVGLGLYYARLFLRPQRRPVPPRLVHPTDKVAIAQQTLQAVTQQVQAIQDEVARQALQGQAEQIAAQLQGRPLRLVVFGTGSTGKTALVNAILDQVAGTVGPTLGTTTTAIAHPLRLVGLARDLWLTDTPGLLEAGVMGTAREQATRELAVTADLLIFVVDNDLRQSEWATLQALIEMGKRSLLVLNKQDLRTPADNEAILQRLRQRVAGAIAPADVVAIAAQPQPVPLLTGEWVTPDPMIDPLLERLALVLRAEGETLVADSILLQAKRLSDTTQAAIAQERQQQAEAIIDRFQWIGAGVVAVTPLPVVDWLATVAVNAQLVLELGRVYGYEVSLEEGRRLALALAKTLITLGLVKGGMQVLNVALHANAITFIVGRGLQGLTAAYLTRIAGQSFQAYFQQHQTWGDGGITAVVAAQFQLQQRETVMRQFVATAIARVIEPLHLDHPEQSLDSREESA